MRPSQAIHVLLDGRAQPAPPPLALRAGPLSLLLEDGGLRYIRLGRHEIVRRIYAAVRDEKIDQRPVLF